MDTFFQGNLTDADTAQLVKHRRHLHMHPELSLQEHQTAAYIEAQLHAEGIPQVTRLAQTGVVALIQGAHPGPTLAFRGDIDALPILEENEVPYKSQNPGVMHACGHDVHTTLGLGIARQMWRRRDEIHGAIKCIFQPAEEASPEHEPIGAERMVQEGVLEGPKVDAIFACHCMPGLPVGTVGHTGGAVWAESTLVEITVHGQKTHAAYPHSGVDAVVVAAQLIGALQTIPSRRLDARKPCVLSIGKLVAGESYNIIADRAELTGTLRTLAHETTEEACAQIEQTAKGLAQAFGAQIEVAFTPGARLTANDPGLESKTVALMREILGQAGPQIVLPYPPQMGAEDFAAFSGRVPGCYVFLGVGNEACGITHMIHTTRFDVDERCLGFGVGLMSEVLIQTGKRWS